MNIWKKIVDRSLTSIFKVGLFDYHKKFRIFGLHKIIYKMREDLQEKTIYFIIMENILNTHKVIHEKYDIKGSLYKRKTFEV